MRIPSQHTYMHAHRYKWMAICRSTKAKISLFQRKLHSECPSHVSTHTHTVPLSRHPRHVHIGRCIPSTLASHTFLFLPTHSSRTLAPQYTVFRTIRMVPSTGKAGITSCIKYTIPLLSYASFPSPVSPISSLFTLFPLLPYHLSPCVIASVTLLCHYHCLDTKGRVFSRQCRVLVSVSSNVTIRQCASCSPAHCRRHSLLIGNFPVFFSFSGTQ